MEKSDGSHPDFNHMVEAVDSAICESYFKTVSNKTPVENGENKNQNVVIGTKKPTSRSVTETEKNEDETLTSIENNKLIEVENFASNEVDEDKYAIDNNKSAVENNVKTRKGQDYSVIRFLLNSPRQQLTYNYCSPNVGTAENNDNDCTVKNDIDEDSQRTIQVIIKKETEEFNTSETQAVINNINNNVTKAEDSSESENTTETAKDMDKEKDLRHVIDRTSGKWLTCRDCGDSFPDAFNLSHHKRTVCGNSHIVRSHKCQLCERLFSTSSQLRKHLRTHTGTKPYKCNVCSKQFTQSHNLKRHVLIHSGEQPFQCMICKQNFTCAANVKRHIKLKHAKDVDMSPDNISLIENLVKRTPAKRNSLQDKTLTSILDIPAEESEEVIMPKRKKFKGNNFCLICNKEFKRSMHLREHMYLHTGERPYLCDVCGFSATFKSGLNKHLRTHFKSKAFTCDYCDKAFYRQVDLEAHHSQMHSKMRDFVCGLCTAQFSTPYTLKRHVSQCHMPEQLHVSDTSEQEFKSEEPNNQMLAENETASDVDEST